jgi:hypothetical protein
VTREALPIIDQRAMEVLIEKKRQANSPGRRKIGKFSISDRRRGRIQALI